MSIEEVADARRWMAFHSVGTYELLLEIQASLEDFLGATREGQHGVAALAARSVVMRCMAARAIKMYGDMPEFDNPFHDPFRGLDSELVAEAQELIGRIASERGVALVEEVVEYVAAYTRELGFAQPPPSVRRPDGLFPAIGMAREVLPLNEASGFPLALPNEWLPIPRDTAE